MPMMASLMTLAPHTPWWASPSWVRITRPDDAVLVGIWILVALAALAGRLARSPARPAAGPAELPSGASEGPDPDPRRAAG